METPRVDIESIMCIITRADGQRYRWEGERHNRHRLEVVARMIDPDYTFDLSWGTQVFTPERTIKMTFTTSGEATLTRLAETDLLCDPNAGRHITEALCAWAAFRDAKRPIHSAKALLALNEAMSRLEKWDPLV